MKNIQIEKEKPENIKTSRAPSQIDNTVNSINNTIQFYYSLSLNNVHMHV